MPSGTSQDNGKPKWCDRSLIDKERTISQVADSDMSNAPTISCHGSACGSDFLKGLVIVDNPFITWLVLEVDMPVGHEWAE